MVRELGDTEALQLALVENLQREDLNPVKALALVKDEASRLALLNDAIASSLSLSQIRERVRATQPPPEQGEFAARIDATTKRVIEKIQILSIWALFGLNICLSPVS